VLVIGRPVRPTFTSAQVGRSPAALAYDDGPRVGGRSEGRAPAPGAVLAGRGVRPGQGADADALAQFAGAAPVKTAGKRRPSTSTDRVTAPSSSAGMAKEWTAVAVAPGSRVPPKSVVTSS
jgi:hypothetical protein